MYQPSFFAISPGSLEVGRCPFDIYLAGEQEITRAHRCGELLNAGLHARLRQRSGEVFIERREIRSYIAYVTERLGSLVSSEHLNTGEIARIIYLVAKRTVGRILLFPREKESIDKARLFMSHLVRTVLGRQGIIRNLFVISSSDAYRHSHAVNVALLNLLVGEKVFGRNEAKLRVAGLAGLLHDIGMVIVPHGIIENAEPLKNEERELVMRHPSEGEKILADHKLPEEVTSAVLQHHEHLDGSGYPGGVSDDAIRPIARLTAISEMFDSLTSRSGSREGLSQIDALTKMADMPQCFDQKMFDQLVRAVFQNDQLVRLFYQGRVAQAQPGRPGGVETAEGEE